ncbi:MAG TPA: iron-containing redox enzyme family protein [Polyangiaceae bacterium]|nr:iron-containing redox enzyme family protein [Polyangiaceae bacterium]
MGAASRTEADLRERLLAVMDQKHHGAFIHLTRPGLSRAQLAIHFRHELHTYVRDFPVLLARVLGQGPPDDVRAALAENIYEEQTGKLSLGRPHPELFLVMMDGLGISRAAISAADPPLEPEAIEYRAYLDRVSRAEPWFVGAAVLTIFVEGSIHERAELAGTRKLPPVDEQVRAHPMVAHYGCPEDHLLLVRAHRAVEGGHRLDAWRMILSHVRAPSDAELVVAAVEEARARWLRYRDGVARAMGVSVEPSPPR